MKLPKIKSPEEQIRDLFIKSGLLVPTSIQIDGAIHRFKSLPDRKDESGWYCFTDGLAIHGAFGDHAQNLTVSFRSDKFSTLSETERQSIEKEEKEKAEIVRQQNEIIKNTIAEALTVKWNALEPATMDNEYIKTKQIHDTYGAKTDGTYLYIPVTSDGKTIRTLQTIAPNGKKHFENGGEKQGNYYILGEGNPYYIAEGFATAASVYESTGKACVIAFDAGNIPAVAGKFSKSLTVIADNDESKKGEECAKQSGCPYILIPEVHMDANDYAVKYGLDALRSIIEKPRFKLITGNDLLTQSEPIKWLVKNYIPRGEMLGMIFGESGSGKTYLAETLICHIATGLDFGNMKMKKGKILYLCGEGFEPFKRRMKVWEQERHKLINPKDFNDNIRVIDEDFKLDTIEGKNALNEYLENTGFKPDLIVIDTLICYMENDENDTKGASQFIQYVKDINRTNHCSSLIIHHTGLAQGAEHRARGSSAFIGAMDYQFQVEKTSDKNVIKLTNTKMKSGIIQDPSYYRRIDTTINGWYDEDGEPLICAYLEVENEVPIEKVDENKKEMPNMGKIEKKLFNYMATDGYIDNDEPKIGFETVKTLCIEDYKYEHPNTEKSDEYEYNRKVIQSGRTNFTNIIKSIKNSQIFMILEDKNAFVCSGNQTVADQISEHIKSMKNT